MDVRLENILDPVEIIVETLAQKPYQSYFRRQRQRYPVPEAIGWKARLEAYFWPTMGQDWFSNKTQFAIFCNRFRELERHWDQRSATTQTGLLSLFEDVCTWGNVRLPEGDQDILINEVDKALHHIDTHQVPLNCRLNSAWTKLYAVARPKSFVIYDSRVATAIVSLLDPHMQRLEEAQEFEPYRDLGYINGRGGTRPRILQWRWTNAYRSWKAQYAANQLCYRIANRLNEIYQKKTGNENLWSMREVEAVLFMEGY